MYKESKVAAIIVAAGASTRMGFDKMLAKIDGEEIILATTNTFAEMDVIDEIVVVASEANIQKVTELMRSIKKVTSVVVGGNTRMNSVAKGVRASTAELIAIQDGARPFVKLETVKKTIAKAYEMGAAAPAVPVKDTIKAVKNNVIQNTLQRNELVAMQTPQVFQRKLYMEALEVLNEKEWQYITDDCMVIEKYGKPVSVVEGDYTNIKITTPDDLKFCELKEEKMMRIGHGYDVHRLVADRPLILGGVEIEYKKGLDGHSDADVLLHAVSDALLGATAMGDIGKLFPDTDAVYKNANSYVLLEQVVHKLLENGFSVCNIDATILCEKPKLQPYVLQIRENIAKALHISLKNVSVKATTEEKLGFTGAGEGIAAHCVCTVTEK